MASRINPDYKTSREIYPWEWKKETRMIRKRHIHNDYIAPIIAKGNIFEKTEAKK